VVYRIVKGVVPVQAPAGWRLRSKSQSHPGGVNPTERKA